MRPQMKRKCDETHGVRSSPGSRQSAHSVVAGSYSSECEPAPSDAAQRGNLWLFSSSGGPNDTQIQNAAKCADKIERDRSRLHWQMNHSHLDFLGSSSSYLSNTKCSIDRYI